jgi:hypothetical protein
MAPTADPQSPAARRKRLCCLLALLGALLAPSHSRALGPASHFSSLAPRTLSSSIERGATTASSWFSDLASNTTITTTSVTPVNPFLRLKDLRPDSEMPGTNGLRSSSLLLRGAFVVESELSRNLHDGTASIRGETSDQRMMRFALMSAAGSVRYGLAYRLAGKAFVNAPDQQVKELWGEWSHGHARLRTSIGEFANNIDADPARPRTIQTQGAMMLTYARPSWPEFSLSYARSLTEGSGTVMGLIPQKSLADRLEGAVAIVRPNWNARLSSCYVVANDQLLSGADTVSYIQTISGTFRPFTPITFTSVLMYRSDVQEWTGVRIHQPMASLSLNYDWTARVRFSAIGGYGSARSSDGLIDNESLNSKGILTWYPLDSTLAQVSFETGYTRTTVSGTVQTITEDLSGLVKLKLTTF